MSEKLLEKFPKARVIAIDGAQAMIDMAKVRLGDLAASVDFKVGDFRDMGTLLPEKNSIDVIISSFALHHLDAQEKLAFAKYLRSILKPGGWILNADCIIMPTASLEKRIQTLRVEGIIKRAAAAGRASRFNTDFASLRTLLDKLEAEEEDKPITLAQELEILKDAGLENVAPLWVEYREAVMCGQKK